MSSSAGSIFVDLLLKDAQYRSGLDRSRQYTKRWSGDTSKEVGGVSTAMAGLTRSFLRFASVAAAGFSLVSLSRAADRVTALEGRLRLSTQTTQEFEKAFQGLADQSIRFGTGLEAGTSVFQRLSFVRKEINATVDEMLQFTETVQALGVASGASGENLRAGLTQLGQGLSSSILRAEEFNSIMENIPAVGAAIAEEFGVSTGQLRQLVINGEVLSEDVFAAILNYTERANEQFEQMPLTISRALASFNAQLDIVARNLFGVSGANQAIAEAIQFGTERLEEMGFFAYVIVEAFEALGIAAKQAFNDAAVAFRDFYNQYSNAIREVTGGVVDFGLITSVFDMEFDNPNAQKRIKDFAKEYGGIFEEEIARSNRKISQDYAKIAEGLSSGDDKEAKKRIDELNRSYEKYEALIKGISQEQLNYQREEAELGELFKANKITLDEYTTALFGLDEKYDELARKADKTGVDLEQFGKRAAENIQDSFADFLFDPFDQGLKGMAKSFIDTIRRMIAEAQAAQLAKAIFGDIAGGEGGGILGGLFSGGSSSGGGLGKFFAGLFADGGVIPPGQFGIVGEGGGWQHAEVVMGGTSGATVIPQGKIGGGNTYNIDARGADQGAVVRLEQALLALAGPGVIEQRVNMAQARGSL